MELLIVLGAIVLLFIGHEESKRDYKESKKRRDKHEYLTLNQDKD